MKHLNIKKITVNFLIILFLAIQTTACRNGGSTISETEDTFTNTGNKDIKISWAAPAEREDNQPISLSEISGYKIYFGRSSRNYTGSIHIDEGYIDSYTLSNPISGTWYFALTTIDTAGRESQYSDEIIITV